MPNQTLKNSHSVPPGKSLQEQIVKLMIKQYGRYENAIAAESMNMHMHRLEGMAATLAILRSSSIDEMMELAKDGYEAKERARTN